MRLVSIVLLSWLSVMPALAADRAKPNIVLIMADDLGYGDLGCYGQKKIRTPHLDRIAKQGVRFTQYYSGSPVCAPSRCVLMSGMHTGHAFIRDNREVKPEGQLPIPENLVTLPRLLKAAGYATGLIGKWGLGPFGSSGDPLKHGFDFFFGYNCQRHAHNFYPKDIYRNNEKVPLEGNNGGATGKQYTHDLMERETLDFVRRNKDQPFFLYLPFTIPHLALQVPEEGLAEYKGQWDEKPYDGKKGYQAHPAPRAAYAAMITRMDRTIGRLLDLLRELQLDDDTIVLFTSDNGPVYEGIGGSDPLFFLSAGILRGFKGSVFEGGLRVPMIVRWPGKIPAGSTADLVAAHQDVMPTICDLVGVKKTADIDGISFAPTLLAKGNQPRHEFLYWEFPGYGGQQAVRMGDWKAVRQNLIKGKGSTEWMLFDLAKDVSESTNVANQHPQIVERIRAIARSERTPSREFPFKGLD